VGIVFFMAKEVRKRKQHISIRTSMKGCEEKKDNFEKERRGKIIRKYVM
jgi:hypothetical protein